MLNDFDEITETPELTGDAQDLINLYHVQRAKLRERVSAFGSGHPEVMSYAKVVSLTASELLGNHGVDADEVVDAIELTAKAQDILNHISTSNRLAFSFALRSVQATTTVHRDGDDGQVFYEAIGRLPIGIPSERRNTLRKLVNLKALTYDIRPAKINATTIAFHQVILTDLGEEMLAQLSD
jgi:hypothetical protein